MNDTLQETVDWLGYISMNEAKFLQELVRSLPENSYVINIGAGAGTSGLAIIQARDDVRLITIDVNEDSPLGCLKGERDTLKKAGVDFDRHTQILGDSKEVARTWAEKWAEKVDMVFVDGDHSFEGARGDITLWMEHLYEGGIMVIHDYDKTGSYMKRMKLTKITEKQMLEEVKPWFHVDGAVDDLLVPFYDVIGQVETTIAFRKPFLK